MITRDRLGRFAGKSGSSSARKTLATGIKSMRSAVKDYKSIHKEATAKSQPRLAKSTAESVFKAKD